MVVGHRAEVTQQVSDPIAAPEELTGRDRTA